MRLHTIVGVLNQGRSMAEAPILITSRASMRKRAVAVVVC